MELKRRGKVIESSISSLTKQAAYWIRVIEAKCYDVGQVKRFEKFQL